MKDVLVKLIDLQSDQLTALQTVADELFALKKTLVFHYREIEDDLKANLSDKQELSEEQQTSRKSISQLRTSLQSLKALAASLPQ